MTFTINPKTREVDHIMPDFEGLLSCEAYAAGVAVTPSNAKIDALLPIFIDDEHFSRARPFLANFLRRLGGRGSWLDVLPKLLNTCVVLLADKGIPASKKVLNTFAYVYRLYLAIAKRDNLVPVIERRIAAFLRLR